MPLFVRKRSIVDCLSKKKKYQHFDNPPDYYKIHLILENLKLLEIHELILNCCSI
jgi:hypothetical protein